MPLVEVCVETAADAARAVEGGAGRIELCADLAADGLTPSADELRATLAAVDVPVHAMVRCRAGDFRYSDAELERMLGEVDAVVNAGAHGIAFGALDADGAVDQEAVGRISERARGLPLTFHRAFDRIADMPGALERLVDLGVPRVLTSGGAPTAWDGRAALRDLIRLAEGRIVVMPGGGVRPHNVRALLAETSASEVHASVPLLP